ncbi:MAG: ATP-binding protein [Planctomycetes bacterium]|nr:ATP-binding protein [Planctomycetota bacterium]
MKRYALNSLKQWKNSSDRKPLIIRGARQVGKSYLVRMFGQEYFDNTIEINFETEVWAEDLFADKKPVDVIAFLEAQYNQRIFAGKTLLFLDEIQAGPKTLASLRYFYEQIPDLHIIAAGSLLDFVLHDHTFSMPVGRIEYLHLGSMSFEEFLQATDNEIKLERLREFSLSDNFNEALHKSLMEDFRKYIIIGGMPGSIQTYIDSGSYLNVQKVQEGILATYQDDFSKYARRTDHTLLRKVFSRIPLLVGQKIKYVNVDPHERSAKLASAIEQLEMAKLLTRVVHTHANGIPLGSEINSRDFKILFLDTGLLCRACRLDMTEVLETDDLLMVNSGAICEQFIGQHLLYNVPSYQQPELYCWIRQKAGTSSEVDYVVQYGTNIIPVEVKAGVTGRLKSLHVFLLEKHRDFALRFNADIPSVVNTVTAVASTESKPFRLLSLPLYMVGQTNRLIKEAVLLEN